MFPKKIIGRYTGTDRNGVTVGMISFLPGHSVECNVSLEMYSALVELCNQGIFDIFEYASVKQVNGVIEDVDVLTSIIESVVDTVLDISISLTSKFDDVKYLDNNLEFYCGEEVLKTVHLPLPEKPREIELSKNKSHLLWRIKPIGKELIPWEELIALADLGYDDTEIKKQINDLTKRLEVLEAK